MFKETITGQRGYFQMVHGVTMKLIAAFADADLDFRPNASMRSVRELILHIYGLEKSLLEGVDAGRISPATEDAAIPEKPEAASDLAAMKTTASALDYARKRHQEADAAFANVTEEKLTAQVESPFGTFAGWQFVNFAYDEHWHHRGQLYTYMRLLGKEPPMLYSYDGPVN